MYIHLQIIGGNAHDPLEPFIQPFQSPSWHAIVPGHGRNSSPNSWDHETIAPLSMTPFVKTPSIQCKYTILLPTRNSQKLFE